MQVIATVICGQETIRMIRITDDIIKINHSIEVPGGADPMVHCLPVGLTQRAGMIVIRPCIWSDCRPEYAYGKMKDLPQGCVGQVFWRERILRFWSLLRRTPACHPVRLLRCVLSYGPG